MDEAEERDRCIPLLKVLKIELSLERLLTNVFELFDLVMYAFPQNLSWQCRFSH
jgi:hypothetical protein